MEAAFSLKNEKSGENLMSYRVNRGLEYALMALNYMSSRKGQWVSVREMCLALRCPFHPFSRSLQKLSDRGVIDSRKGLGGGYRFSGDLKKLSLYKLMSAILPPVEIASCLSGYCRLFEACNIRAPINYLNGRLVDFYKSISIEELLLTGLKRKKSSGPMGQANKKLRRESWGKAGKTDIFSGSRRV